MRFKHDVIEKNSILLLVLTLLVVSIGGLVEIAPLFYLESTIEKVKGMRPYTPLELAGRNIYIREGCYNCHSQMVRPLRDEEERYGHYSLAAESMYDHPFQWGSKRTGPDLARVGGRYSDAWHVAHMADPRSVVPESIMPGYPFLAATPLRMPDVAAHLRTNRAVGVPYSDEMIEMAGQDIAAQAPFLQFLGAKFQLFGATFTLGVVLMLVLVCVLAYALRRTQSWPQVLLLATVMGLLLQMSLPLQTGYVANIEDLLDRLLQGSGTIPGAAEGLTVEQARAQMLALWLSLYGVEHADATLAHANTLFHPFETDIAEYATRIVSFRDGRVRGDRPVAARRDAAVELAVHDAQAIEEEVA